MASPAAISCATTPAGRATTYSMMSMVRIADLTVDGVVAFMMGALR